MGSNLFARPGAKKGQIYTTNGNKGRFSRETEHAPRKIVGLASLAKGCTKILKIILSIIRQYAVSYPSSYFLHAK